MSHCDNMLVWGRCGISLLQQLWGIFKYVKCCGCCSGSKMHFAVGCLCSLIILARLPEECRQEQECWLWTVYISVKASRNFLGWRKSTFFSSRTFFPDWSFRISRDYYGEGRCPSQRKTSKIKFLEIFSNEGFTRFHSLCFIFSLLSGFYKMSRRWVKCGLLKALPSFLWCCLYDCTWTHTHFSLHRGCKYISANLM